VNPFRNVQRHRFNLIIYEPRNLPHGLIQSLDLIRYFHDLFIHHPHRPCFNILRHSPNFFREHRHLRPELLNIRRIIRKLLPLPFSLQYQLIQILNRFRQLLTIRPFLCLDRIDRHNQLINS
jgi:hypothetical protein